MIDKARLAIWMLAIGIFVIIEYYIFGKDHIPGYNVHKARAITFIFFGLATWLIPTKAPLFNRLGRFFVIISIGHFIDEFFIEFIIGGLALLTVFPVKKWLKRLDK
jgi:hypothetical protein